MSKESSTPAKIASNARAALTRLDEETLQLRATHDQMLAEQADLKLEFDGLFSKLNELIAGCEAAQTELHRARLAAEVSQDTPKEDEANNWARTCSDRHDATLVLFQEHSRLIAAREPEIDSRLKFLRHCTADNTKMLKEQQSRRVELQAIFDKAHGEHGIETYRQALEELHALEARRDMEARRAANAESRLNEFRAKLADRFSDWPALAAEVAVAHGFAAEVQFSPVLRAHERYLAELEETLVALPYRPMQPDLFIDDTNLWGLLGINALSLRQYYDLLHMHTPEQNYWKNHSIKSLAGRRQVIRDMVHRLELSARHTTPKEHERVTKHLAEVAGELTAV